MLPFIDNLMSSFLSAYHSRYSTQHVLSRLIKQWRACLDQNKVVEGILMDLSKAFDCLPHDLLIAKLEAYGVEKSSLLLLMSYLKDRKQAVKVKGIRSLFQLIKSVVPQGSILAPMLFKIFINDLFFLLDIDLHNFADDNTISTVSETIPELVDTLTSESNLAIDWFNSNSMFVNPDKFKAIVLTKSGKTPLEYKSTSKITALPRKTQSHFWVLKLTADCPSKIMLVNSVKLLPLN